MKCRQSERNCSRTTVYSSRHFEVGTAILSTKAKPSIQRDAETNPDSHFQQVDCFLSEMLMSLPERAVSTGNATFASMHRPQLQSMSIHFANDSSMSSGGIRSVCWRTGPGRSRLVICHQVLLRCNKLPNFAPMTTSRIQSWLAQRLVTSQRNNRL